MSLYAWLQDRRPVAELLRAPASTPKRWRALAPPTEDYWPQLGFTFALTGAVFPALVGSAWALGKTLWSLATGNGVMAGIDVLWAIMAMATAGVTSVGAGFAYAGLLALITLPAITNVVRLTGELKQDDRAAAIIGSMLALIAMVPFGVLSLRGSLAEDPTANLVWLIHLVAAIGLGQLSGLLAAARDVRRAGRRPPAVPRWGLRQLLLAMVGLSLLLGLLDWLGWLSLPLLLSLVVALGTHLLAKRPLTWLVNHWADRRFARRRAQRLAARST